MQNPPTPNWPTMAAAIPTWGGLKWVDNIQALAEARAHNPNAFLWLRHWYDHGQQFGTSDDFRDYIQQAREFFATFVDGTFDQYAQHINAIEGWNEYNANSHQPHEVAARVASTEARAWVWRNEYRIYPRYKHLRLIIGNVAVGNDIPAGYADIASRYDCIIGYHAYVPVNKPGNVAQAETLLDVGNGPAMRDKQHYAPDAGYIAAQIYTTRTTHSYRDYVLPDEWAHYSGRWAVADAQFQQLGYRNIDWCFTEAGEVGYGIGDGGGVYLRAFDGWKHPTVYGGDINGLLDCVRYWLEMAQQTDAWKQGRVMGGYGAMFTSSANPAGNWPYFDKQTDVLERVVQVTREYPLGNDDPAPPPPPPDPEPEQWRKLVILLPQNLTLNNYLDVAETVAYPTRTEIAFSADAAFAPAMHTKGHKVIVYDVQQWGGVDALESWALDKYEVLPDIEYRQLSEGASGTKPSLEIDDITSNLPTHETKQYGTRALSDITTITVHHSVTSPTTTPEVIARYHVNERDWPGIAYHYLVYNDGAVYQTNALSTVSYHAGNGNPYSVGVCLVGDFTTEEPNTEQLHATGLLIHHIETQVGDTLGVTPHKRMPGASTACPGATWSRWGPWLAVETDPPPDSPAHWLDVMQE